MYHVKAAQDYACALVSRGVPEAEATRRAVAYGRELARSSMGEFGAGIDTIRQAADLEPVKVVREAVSPWLWVFSVIGFGMAILNTQRIAKMYRDWKTKGEAR